MNCQTIRVHDTVSQSTIYGPGNRYVIWVQGCSLSCPGCWNIETWDKNGGEVRLISELIEEYESTGPHEGITIMGGEPLQQSSACLTLIEGIRDSNGSIVLYTGYEPNEFDETMQKCFMASDLVISGRYVQELRDIGLRWRGSSNQVIHRVSELYSELEIEEMNEVEITIDQDTGQVQVFGYPTLELLEMMEFDLGIEVLQNRAPRLRHSEQY